MHLSKQIESMYDDAVRIRQYLHRIPEIGFQLRDTQAYVLRELRQCSPDRIETPAVCGVKAVFFARDAETTIAFRADMDGIHNDEANNVPYCSQHPGNMHGCGHDGHMTILLLFARWIAKNRAHIHCNIVLLFQPGEEGWAGARRMIDDGALENPKVDRIYGLHLWPTVPKGKIGVRWDYLMAQTSDFDITVHGKSAHASTPQMGIDAIVVAAELVTMVQTVITRDVDPHQDALLTLGKIQGGTSHNVIAEEVTISGTLRVFSNELYRTLSHKIAALMQGLETATGAQIDMDRKVRYPSVRNPRELVEQFYTVLDSMDGPGGARHGGGGFCRIPAGDPGPVFLPRRAGADRYRPAAQQSFQFRRARFADRRRNVQTDTGV
jgi:amidohydrolase